MSEVKHSWTKKELRTVCVCYIMGAPHETALRLTNTTNEKSMEMRYRNCLFLEKGPVEGSLSHASKTHVEAWNDVHEIYNIIKEVDSEKLSSEGYTQTTLNELIKETEVNSLVETSIMIGIALCGLLSLYAIYVSK